ncbi:rRNA accumulation-related protein [Clarireedia jacksonii]
MSASQSQAQGASSSSAANGASSSQETRLLAFQRSLTLLLFLWPSLTLAVTSQWGGPDSASKREWFAGTVIDLLCAGENLDVDAEWIEELLLQVMEDEFEVVVEDGSAGEVAERMVRARAECMRGDFKGVEELERRWEVVGRKGGKGGEGVFKKGEDQGDTSGDEEEDSEDEDEEGDVEMDEAPQLVRVKEPVVPEVDEDGFTKVVKKKR